MKTSQCSKYAFCTHLPSSLVSSLVLLQMTHDWLSPGWLQLFPSWLSCCEFRYQRSKVLTIAGTVLMFLDDLPTCLRNNKKGVQVETFIEIRFSCLHGLGNSSILTPWLLFLWCTRSWRCLSHFEAGLCSETDFKQVGLDLVFQAIKTK